MTKYVLLPQTDHTQSIFEKYCLMKCDAAQTGKKVPTYRKKLLPPTSNCSILRRIIRNV